MAEVPANNVRPITLTPLVATVASAIQVDPRAEAEFRAKRIKRLSPLYQGGAPGNTYIVETVPLSEPPETALSTTMLAPVTAEQCAAGIAAAREVSAELGWNSLWDIVDGVIVARYEDSASELITRTSLDFYAKLAERLGAPMLQALMFDLDSGAE